MNGRIAGYAILISAALAGAGVYYLQVWGYYDRLAPDAPAAQIAVTRADGTVEPLAVADVQAIDSGSSPIRFRACFTLPAGFDPAGYAPYPAAEPLVAPGWFDCFDARALGAALAAGQATAILGQENYRYGIDRVLAVTPDGRGYAWHQINRCGAEVFEGRPAPRGCPPPPARTGN